MSILSNIIAAIETRVYPLFKDTVDAVIAKAEEVKSEVVAAGEAVVETVADIEAAVEKVEETADEIAAAILASPVRRHRARESLAAARAAHKAETGEDLDYPHSVVDLIKLIGIEGLDDGEKKDEAEADRDASYAAREDLAHELGIKDYRGNPDQNVAMAHEIMERLE